MCRGVLLACLFLLPDFVFGLFVCVSVPITERKFLPETRDALMDADAELPWQEIELAYGTTHMLFVLVVVLKPRTPSHLLTFTPLHEGARISE